LLEGSDIADYTKWSGRIRAERSKGDLEREKGMDIDEAGTLSSLSVRIAGRNRLTSCLVLATTAVAALTA